MEQRPTTPETPGSAPSSGIDRRTAIKAVAGGAAASIVWAEPTIKGLARRPAFAAATSAPSSVETSVGSIPALVTDPGLINVQALTTVTTSNGTPVEVALVQNARPGVYVLGVQATIAGCNCAIGGNTSGTPSASITTDQGTVVPAFVDPFLIFFQLPPGELPATITWTNLLVTCA